MKPIKKRILVVLLLLSMIIGFGFNKISRLSKIKKTNEILQNKNAKEAFISEWYKALDNSNFSIDERQILIDDFLPYLLDNFDMYDVNALANLLSSTANTYVYYVDEWGNDNTKASYTNFLSYVPFGACICEGVITLENNNDDNCFLHEYYHSTQSWNWQDSIYWEAYANFCGGGNYDDLYAIFTMLGDLSDKEYLLKSLINGKIDDYWNYFVELYPGNEELINDLRKEIENVFFCTYKSDVGRYEAFQKEMRNSVLDKVKYLYFLKYGTEIECDALFQILVDMYSLESKYHGLNNPLLSQEFVYTFDDDSGSYIFIINDSNRFLGKENLLFK